MRKDISIPTDSPIIVFKYLDYREYLKEMVEWLKKEKNSFSFRYFSRLAGMGGHSFLRMVMRGERNMSPNSVSKFTRALKLSVKEAEYFEVLVLYNQSLSQAERDRYYSQLMTLRPKIKITGLQKDQFEYLTNSHYVTIREMAALPVFSEDPAWISQHLRHTISPKEAKHAVEVLLRLGLLIRDENGHVKHSGTTLETPYQSNSIEVFNYHRQVLSESRDIMVTAPYDEWDVASMTIPVSKEFLPEIMSILKKCREQIADMVNKDKSPLHEIMQINMQMIPVTKTSTPTEDEE